MKSRPSLCGWPALAALALALSFYPSDLGAQPKPTSSTPAPTAGRRYDFEIVDNKLQLANIKDRISSKWSNMSSVEASLRNLVEILGELHTNVNIVVGPGVDDFIISNLKLRSSQLENELEAIRVAGEDRFMWEVRGAEVQPGGIDPTTGTLFPIKVGLTPLYVLSPVSRRDADRGVEVFNLSGYFGTLAKLGTGDEKEKEQSLQMIQQIITRTLTEVSADIQRPAFQFHSGADLLIVIGPQAALDVSRKVISALPGIGSAGVRGSNTSGNPFAMTKDRRAITGKLESIRLDLVSLDNVPLGDAVRLIAEETKGRDPEKRGINFILQAGPPGSGNLAGVPIKIIPPLDHVRILDVLDAIVRVAGQPIKYTVTDYAVVFSLRGPNEPVETPPPYPSPR